MYQTIFTYLCLYSHLYTYLAIMRKDDARTLKSVCTKTHKINYFSFWDVKIMLLFGTSKLCKYEVTTHYKQIYLYKELIIPKNFNSLLMSEKYIIYKYVSERSVGVAQWAITNGFGSRWARVLQPVLGTSKIKIISNQKIPTYKYECDCTVDPTA